MPDEDEIEEKEIDEEIADMMKSHGLDEEDAERAVGLVDELGVDEEGAAELAEEGEEV